MLCMTTRRDCSFEIRAKFNVSFQFYLSRSLFVLFAVGFPWWRTIPHENFVEKSTNNTLPFDNFCWSFCNQFRSVLCFLPSSSSYSNIALWHICCCIRHCCCCCCHCCCCWGFPCLTETYTFSPVTIYVIYVCIDFLLSLFPCLVLHFPLKRWYHVALDKHSQNVQRCNVLINKNLWPSIE